MGRARAERVAPLLAGAALAAPTLLAYYLPMSDLPLHEGALAALVRLGDTSWFTPGMYYRHIGHPNQLFYLLAWPLALLFGTAWACKLVVAAAQILTMTGGARLADHLHRPRWGALLLAPLALGFTYYWGLIANLIGFAALLYALPSLDRFAERPTWRALPSMAAWLGLLFFAHESVFAVATGVAFVFGLLRPLSRRETFLRLAPVGLAVLTVLLHQPYQDKFLTRSAVVTPMTFSAPLESVLMVPNVVFGSHDPLIRTLMFVAGVGGMAALFASRVPANEDTEPLAAFGSAGALQRARWLRSLLLRRRFELLGFVFLVAYFVAPFSWNGATMIRERFLGPAWALLALCAGPRGGDTSRIAKIATTVLPTAILLVSWPQFVDASRTFRALDPILAAIPQNRAVALCSMDPAGRFGTRIYSAAVGPARSLALRGGRSGLYLVSPISPVQMRRELAWDDWDRRIVLYGSRGLRPTHDLRMFEYVIGQSRDPGTRELMIEALEPEAELLATSGEWMLFRSTLAVRPVDAPELPNPGKIDTVLDRVNFLLGRRAAQSSSVPLRAPQSP